MSDSESPMATGAPPGAPHGPGQVPGEGAGAGAGVGGEVVSDQLGGGPTPPGNPSGEQSGSLKSQPVGDPVPLGSHLLGGAQAGPQVSVAGHVQHVSVAGQVQQAGGGGGEVIISGGNNGVVPPGADGDDAPQKRKATSFKITNVFLSRPPSNDGDDSCDDNEDLEDSHTEGANVAINFEIVKASLILKLPEPTHAILHNFLEPKHGNIDSVLPYLVSSVA